MTERVCFRVALRPELVDEYVAAHSAVWPEMLRAIQRSGRRNYTLFLDADDATVTGYYETDDDEASARLLSADPVATRWEAESSRFFAGLGGRADENARHLTPIFRLEDQLATSGDAS